MKVLIDARGATWYSGTGIGTYTCNLIKNLISIDKKNSYDLFWSGENYKDFTKDNVNILMASKKHQRFFENYFMPQYSKASSSDLYHVPQNGIGLNENFNCLKVVTIHDLIPYTLPETVGKGYLKNFLKSMPNILDNCDGILTVSEYSKKDILKFFPSFPEERIFVTPLAANSNFKPLDKEKCLFDVQKRFSFNTPYILYLGGFSTRKNVKSLINSFNDIYKKLDKNYSLLIVGSLRDEGLKIKDLASSLECTNNIIFPGFIEDEYLPTLYSGSDLFVYPSLYEGFGLPPLEAMSCKTPVISSNITSIPEVVDKHGILIDPYDYKSLSSSMLKILNDESLKSSLIESGYKHSLNFSWENTAYNTLNAYEKIYSLGKLIK